MKKLSTLLALATLCCSSVSQAQTSRSKSYPSQSLSQNARTAISSANPWRSVPEGMAPSERLLRMHPQKYLVYSLDVPTLRLQLFSAGSTPEEAVTVTLPMPDGSFRDFKAWQENMLTGEMAERYPDIRTFTAVAVGDQRITAKLDFTLFGFHSMVYQSGSTSFVDPYDNYNDGYYLVHYKSDEVRNFADRVKCEVKTENDEVAGHTPFTFIQRDLTANSKTNLPTVNTSAMMRTGNGATKRSYRLALSADHFYCQAATGLATPTIAQCLSTMTTTMNRVNGVYNREIAVQLNFCTKEDTLIWPVLSGSVNGADPFNTIDASGSSCLPANQTQCDTRIGSSAYDVGHVFTTGGGGLAAVGIVCNASSKAQGVTGSPTPTGDGFDIDYVAHEMGHEFGSNHTFNNNQDGSCGGNANTTTAYEPGSGATIMDYAGICNPDDLQPHSDPYFNASSLKQIISQMVSTETTCATTAATAHDTGTVTRFDYTYNIPYKTPFEFTGPTATVTTGDTAITYQLYQWNLGLTAAGGYGNRLNQASVKSPIFRSFDPVYTPYRVFPKLSMVLAGTLSDAGTENAEGEKAADTTRDITIKMAIRNILNGYGCANVLDQDSVLIHAYSTGTTGAYAGFKVTSQNSAGITYAGGSTQAVTWNVVGTNAAPVSADSVDIFMSVDGGYTWAYTIGRFINNGSASVTIPNPATTSTTSRIKVKGKNNIFFNINSSNFTVTALAATSPITGTFTVCPSGGTTTLADVTTGGTWSSSNTAVGTVGLATGVVTGIASGTTVITYTASAGTVTAIVTVEPATSAGSITGTAAACIGATTTLSDAVTGGAWSSFNTAVATVSSSGVVTGVTAGTSTISYVVTGTCGTATATMVVTISAPTAVSAITGTFSACAGNTTTLADVTPSGTWSSTNTAVATVNASGVVTGIMAGTTTISYNVTSGSGCVSNAAAIVTINALPSGVILPSGTVTICTTGSATLTASTGAGYTYQWHNGAGVIAGATNSTYVTSTADNYYAVITGTGGCVTTTASVSVVVSAGFTVTPLVTITSPGGASACASTLVTFTANPVNGGTAPTYQWYVNSVAVGTGATYTYMPANGDTVECQMISNAACASPTTVVTSIVMTVASPATPSLTVIASPHDTVCAGDPVTYIAVPVYGGAAPTYLWIENGINVGTGPTYTPATAHNGDHVYCVMNSSYACRTTTVVTSPTITMHVLPLGTNTVTVTASATSITAGSSVTFTATAPYATSYQWYINGSPVTGATSSVFVTSALVDGSVVNCAVTASLCASPATAISGGLTMHVSSGVEETNPTLFEIMPNPTKGTFVITGTLGHTADNTVALSVANMLGQVVYRSDLQAANGSVHEQVTLNASLANGMYLVKLTSGDEHAVFHLLLER